jgi:hypothetical protein
MSSSNIHTISSKYRRRAKTQCEYTFHKEGEARREELEDSKAGHRMKASDVTHPAGKENSEPNSTYSIVLSNVHEAGEQNSKRHSRVESKSNLHANFLFTSASLESCLGLVNQTLIEYYMSTSLLREGCAKIGKQRRHADRRYFAEFKHVEELRRQLHNGVDLQVDSLLSQMAQSKQGHALKMQNMLNSFSIAQAELRVDSL